MVVVVLISVVVMAGQPRCIDNPTVEKTNSDFLSVAKIELTDTATILFVDAYNSPGYWVQVDSGTFLRGKESGNTYKLLRAEGFEIGKKTPMPENGTVAFQLFFEPLAPEETAIDYCESEKAEDCFLGNIQLKKQPRNEKIHCRIVGQVNDRPNSSRLMLKRPVDDERIATPVYLPIRNGKFEYDLYCNEIEMYELCFVDELQNGAWQPFQFFAEPGEVKIELYPMGEGILHNRASGSKVNKLYNNFLDECENASSLKQLSYQLELMEKQGKYYTPEAQSLMDRANAARKDRVVYDSLWNEYSKRYDNNDNDITDEAKKMEESIEKAYCRDEEWIRAYVGAHPSFVAYHVVYDAIRSKLVYGSQRDVSEYIRLAKEQYMPAYAGHIYTKRLNEILTTLDSIRVGGHYLDFAAPDLKGEKQQLSALIGGKIALIDLWASWCGGCRKHSKTVIPLYEQYKEKGFTVVGVARERENTRNMVKAIEEDRYPWMQLVELNDQNGIWNRYGCGGAGGSSWLVDRDGKILAVNPSAEEIEQILNQKL